MPGSDHYCEDCDTSFNTMTRYRLHNCEDHRDPTSETGPGSEDENPERFDFEGEVETWSGTVEATFEGTINEQARGRNCAHCNDDAVALLRPRVEWNDILCEEHDYRALTGHELIPLCPPCHVQLESLRDAEAEMGYMDDATREKIKTDRQEILSALDTDAIFVDESVTT